MKSSLNPKNRQWQKAESYAGEDPGNHQLLSSIKNWLLAQRDEKTGRAWLKYQTGVRGFNHSLWLTTGLEDRLAGKCENERME